MISYDCDKAYNFTNLYQANKVNEKIREIVKSIIDRGPTAVSSSFDKIVHKIG